MSVFVPWGHRRSSIFDLSHIGGLSPNRTLPLFVSPQVLYALQNVALVEIADSNRYAVELATGGYYRVQPSDIDDYALFLEIVSQTGLQLSDYLTMSTPLNYKGILTVQTSEPNAAAGANTLAIQGPGADEVWVLDHIAFQNHNSAVTDAILYLYNGSTNFVLQQAGNLGADIWRHYVGPVHLSNDLALKCLFTGCASGDDLYLQATGHSMELLT